MGRGLVGSKVGNRGWCGVNAEKGVRVWLGGGQGGCEPRIEVIVKIQKKSGEGGRSGGVCVWGGGGGGQGGCEPRIEVIVKMQKKVGRGVRSGGGQSGGVWRIGNY